MHFFRLVALVRDSWLREHQPNSKAADGNSQDMQRTGAEHAAAVPRRLLALKATGWCIRSLWWEVICVSPRSTNPAWRTAPKTLGALYWRRFFAEECDSLQGFQALAEDLSGFGQLAADMLQARA